MHILATILDFPRDTLTRTPPFTKSEFPKESEDDDDDNQRFEFDP